MPARRGNKNEKGRRLWTDKDGVEYDPREIISLFLEEHHRSGWELKENDTDGRKGCQWKLTFVRVRPYGDPQQLEDLGWPMERIEIYCSTGTINTTCQHNKYVVKGHMRVWYHTNYAGLEKKARYGVRAHLRGASRWDEYHDREEVKRFNRKLFRVD